MTSIESEKDYYDILQIDSVASMEEIQASYHRRVEELATPPHESTMESIAALQRLWTAYETLIDARRREEYDRELFDEYVEVVTSIASPVSSVSEIEHLEESLKAQFKNVTALRDEAIMKCADCQTEVDLLREDLHRLAKAHQQEVQNHARKERERKNSWWFWGRVRLGLEPPPEVLRLGDPRSQSVAEMREKEEDLREMEARVVEAEDVVKAMDEQVSRVRGMMEKAGVWKEEDEGSELARANGASILNLPFRIKRARSESPVNSLKRMRLDERGTLARPLRRNGLRG